MRATARSRRLAQRQKPAVAHAAGGAAAWERVEARSDRHARVANVPPERLDLRVRFRQLVRDNGVIREPTSGAQRARGLYPHTTASASRRCARPPEYFVTCLCGGFSCVHEMTLPVGQLPQGSRLRPHDMLPGRTPGRGGDLLAERSRLPRRGDGSRAHAADGVVAHVRTGHARGLRCCTAVADTTTATTTERRVLSLPADPSGTGTEPESVARLTSATETRAITHPRRRVGVPVASMDWRGEGPE
jgi:hypothetical protein